VLPEGDESLEHKLEGLAFGLLIPTFFITSGMAIDPFSDCRSPDRAAHLHPRHSSRSWRSGLCGKSHRARP
jgi:hypothetical protein